ncbi:ParB/Srx family N-terminal domain-containing protein [Caballeronia choica]|uniref:ParB/Srx family N-terminal domain-containing protein n=1 Tax=Caballeronia choica TaxID=326476 RepID=UPI001F302DF0|nr:ParB/Srx family N-terminal domain-containing protein [Caballeronia choica]
MDQVENRTTETVLERSFGNDTQIEYVPLALLCKSPHNVRRKAPTGIETLAENIATAGVMQNLVAHEMKARGKQRKLGVCAGQRRLLALELLRTTGRIDDSYPVPVKVVSEADAVAVSLIENQQREPCIRRTPAKHSTSWSMKAVRWTTLRLFSRYLKSRCKGPETCERVAAPDRRLSRRRHDAGTDPHACTDGRSRTAGTPVV